MAWLFVLVSARRDPGAVRWFSRAYVTHCPPLLSPGLSACPPSTSSKLIPHISRAVRVRLGCDGQLQAHLFRAVYLLVAARGTARDRGGRAGKRRDCFLFLFADSLAGSGGRPLVYLRPRPLLPRLQALPCPTPRPRARYAKPRAAAFSRPSSDLQIRRYPYGHPDLVQIRSVTSGSVPATRP